MIRSSIPPRYICCCWPWVFFSSIKYVLIPTCVLMLYTLLKCNYPSTNRICWPQGTLFNSWARQSSSHFWNRCPIRHQIVVKNTKKKADSLSGIDWKREGVQILIFGLPKGQNEIYLWKITCLVEMIRSACYIQFHI